MSPNTKNGHLEYWEDQAIKRSDARRKKGRPKMKVSGAGVKQLSRIISKKA